MRHWVWFVAMSTACSFPTTPWRDLGFGEFGGGYAQFGADDCVAFVPVVLADQTAFDAWSATLLGIPSAAGVEYLVVANYESLDALSVLWHAAAFDADTWSTVSAAVTFQ